MELDKKQLKKIKKRHARRHGIHPLHSRALMRATRFLKKSFNVKQGRAPYDAIRKRFVNGSKIDGTHLCILIVAMLTASIGLNLDSDIAIIGAMLICPLMGSVLAIAYGIATLDRKIVTDAVAGLLLQMSICIMTSTIYFAVSPVSTITSAIVDNSTPTIWDLILALIGGIAGGLGNSRNQEPATLISGVAVATALMPPLCAVGYGVANASMPIIASAFYEFAINIVFIALGAETILLALHVPLKLDINDDGVVTPDEKRKIIVLSRKMRRLIIAATVVFALPCIAITAENVGANGTVLDDGYSVIATTRELSSVLPGFVRYGIGWETSTSNGKLGEPVSDGDGTDDVTGDGGAKASQLLVARVETEHGIGLSDRQTAEKLIKTNVPGVNRIVFTTSSGQTVIAE